MNDTTPDFLETPSGARLAYHHLPGASPGIVFLGGFQSDMTGTKATTLEAFAKAQGHAFLRFDYRGHGQSSGMMREGCIGHWKEDALAVVDQLTEGPQVLVGSSMGGWLALLVALARPERVCGLVGVAAAPDFTEDLMWDQFDEQTRTLILRDGMYQRPSEYSEEPYVITRTLIEEGRRHLLLRAAVPLQVPVRLLHGMQDEDVPYTTALRLAERLETEDVRIELFKSGDHRLSGDLELKVLQEQVQELLQRSSENLP
jgi:pimeloyl-ACP methyl ester carboxylesterase